MARSTRPSNAWDDLDRELAQITFNNGEQIERWTWTYRGTQVSVTEVIGPVSYRWTNLYDERDRLIGTESFDLAANQLTAVSSIRYDVRDRPIEHAQDDGVDGTIEQRVFWDYCD